MTETKTCAKCGQTKPVTAFRSRGGAQKHLLKSYCNSCLKEQHKTWVEKNPERVKEYREKDPWTLEKRCRRYGITVKQLCDAYESQVGKCKICSQNITMIDSAIDHNHKTGEFRGLLCKRCNRALGLFKDNPEVIQNAADYLKTQGHYG